SSGACRTSGTRTTTARAPSSDGPGPTRSCGPARVARGRCSAPRQVRRAHDARLVAVLGELDRGDGAVAHRGELRLEAAAHGAEQQVAGRADAAADHDELGVEQRGDGRRALADPPAEGREQLDRELVAL